MVVSAKLQLAVLAVVIVVVVGAVTVLPELGKSLSGDPDQPPAPAPTPDPTPTPDPEPDPTPTPDPQVPEYPEGIAFDASTGALIADAEIDWVIEDQLYKHIDKVKEKKTGTKVVLPSGYYKVTAKGETFDVIVDGTVSKSAGWNYHYNGQVFSISVTYEIDIRELAEIMMDNREWNNQRLEKKSFKLYELPDKVYVGDTVMKLEKEMERIFVDELEGSLDDRQALADFLVSFAQLGIEYPHASYTWVDEKGKPVYEVINGKSVPKKSTDYEVWGCVEYWANSLETMFFGTGDCEDSSAVACSILSAAGFRTAMAGLYGHVNAGVALDDFQVRDLNDYDFLSVRNSMKEGYGPAVRSSDPTIYYGVETISGQAPVGYMISKYVDSVTEEGSTYVDLDYVQWFSGFYPVQGDVDGIHSSSKV